MDSKSTSAMKDTIYVRRPVHSAQGVFGNGTSEPLGSCRSAKSAVSAEEEDVATAPPNFIIFFFLPVFGSVTTSTVGSSGPHTSLKISAHHVRLRGAMGPVIPHGSEYSRS